jgi:transcriptional regulator with XRE-family HTH domain
VPFSGTYATIVAVAVTPSEDSQFGEWVKARRQSLGMSLRQLSEKTQMSNPYLSQVERGLTFPDDLVRDRLIAALGDSSEGP